MSSSNNPLWPLPLVLARHTAGVPWTPSEPVIQLFGHPLKIKELIDQLSYWTVYDFPTNKIPPTHWIEYKAMLARIHGAFLFSNYLLTKIAFSVLHSGHTYRHYKVDLEIFWEMANEQYKELTRLIKKGEHDTFEALHLRQPDVGDKLTPLHQSGMVGFELMPYFLEILTRNDLLTGLAARVKALTDDVQRILQDAGDYTMPPEMNSAEFQEVLTRIANSSSAAARRSGHARQEAQAIPSIFNASQQQSTDPAAADMSAMRLGNVTAAGPTEGEMRRMLEYAGEADSVPESEPGCATADKPPPVIQSVKISQPVVITPSERRLRRRRSHSIVMVGEQGIVVENSDYRTEK